jgi:hypothetical protein
VLRRLAELCHLEVVVSRKMAPKNGSEIGSQPKKVACRCCGSNGCGSKSQSSVAVAVADLWLPARKTFAKSKLVNEHLYVN